MRMWMTDPSIMCRKHLLGEHVEIHMIVGHMKKFRSIKGFVKNNCIEPESLMSRHSQLVNEMVSRGYNHKSELDIPVNLLDYLSEEDRLAKVLANLSLEDLTTRCSNCLANHTAKEIDND